MSNREWLQQMTNGCTADDFPDGQKLIALCLKEVRDLYGAPGVMTPESLVAAVLAGIARADVRGLISVGDEHEWATLSLMAAEFHSNLVDKP